MDTNLTTAVHNASGTAPSLAVPLTMATAGITGNVLAVIVLYHAPTEQKNTVFYRLVGLLAITDIFGICTTTPVTLLIYANGLKWMGGQHLCNYGSFMLIFAGLATIFILAGMALDRFLALNKPYFYSSHMGPEKVLYIFPALVIAALLFACLPLIGVGDNVNHFPGSWCFFDFYGSSFRVKSFAYLYGLTGVIAITFIGTLNTVVIRTVIAMRNRTNVQQRSTRKFDSEVQMVVFLLGIFLIFSSCWAPLMVRVFLIQTGLSPKDPILDLVFVRMASFNQILDPWVYILFRKNFILRIFTFIKILLCKKTKKRQLNTSANEGTHGLIKKDESFRNVLNTDVINGQTSLIQKRT